MKKIILLFVLITLFDGCTIDLINPESTDEPVSLKTLSAFVDLPDNTSISESDLTVSSLFSENPILNGNSEIISFDNNSMELAFVTNQEGNIVMMSYFNPLNNSIVEINAESTALALVMLHPWTFDLSASAKAEAIEFIKNLSEFESFSLQVQSSLESGGLDPLNTQSVLEKLVEIQIITSDRSIESLNPLELEFQNSTVSVKNVQSSATYSIGLYDEDNVLFSRKEAKGLDKSHFFFQEFKNYFFQGSTSDKQTATFDIPTTGQWTLKAKSGLSFDGSVENRRAAFYNTTKVIANIFGVFSTELEELIIKDQCFISIGKTVYEGVSGQINISESIESYSNDSLSGYDLTKKILSFSYSRFDQILDLVKDCSGEDLDLGKLGLLRSGVKQILNFLNVLSKIETSFNTTSMLTDWVQYDSEIEFCVVKSLNDISECDPIMGAGTCIIEGNYYDVDNGWFWIDVGTPWPYSSASQIDLCSIEYDSLENQGLMEQEVHLNIFFEGLSLDGDFTGSQIGFAYVNYIENGIEKEFWYSIGDNLSSESSVSITKDGVIYNITYDIKSTDGQPGFQGSFSGPLVDWDDL